MARIPYRKVPGKIAAGAALVALLGAGAAGLTLETVADFEGYVPEAYQDPVGIWTKCWGDTYDVTPGATYTFDECVRSLNEQTLAHAKPVMECVPELVHRDDLVKASFVSMAYNVGVNGFCKSSVVRKANAGDWRGACKRIAQIYKTAGGKELAGLVKRRNVESDMCLRGLEREGL